MADEFQNRKDIEKLYNLIYARTTDSPVTQKLEFDEFRETVTNNYVLFETFQEQINQIMELISDLSDRVEELEQ